MDWRHVFLWKDSTIQQDDMPKSMVIIGDEPGIEEEGGEAELEIPKNVFLSTIRVFKYTNDSKPECVKEILCENNIKPAMDYGPSVAYFGKCLYYFKREVRSAEDQTHQLYKFEFDGYKETKIEGFSFLE